MNPGGETTIVSSAHALDTAVENLLDASLTPLLDEEFIAVMREVETSMRKLEAVKHRFVTETCTLPGRACRVGVPGQILGTDLAAQPR
ncbi:hypothetical protein [Nocardia sp. NBC_01388]|uniref:hypothetical protein n=1 Tax=Nocardia sp. NBC_01388 TaxID=2903596 RepID=UPI0032433B84